MYKYTTDVIIAICSPTLAEITALKRSAAIGGNGIKSLSSSVHKLILSTRPLEPYHRKQIWNGNKIDLYWILSFFRVFHTLLYVSLWKFDLYRNWYVWGIGGALRKLFNHHLHHVISIRYPINFILFNFLSKVLVCS